MSILIKTVTGETVTKRTPLSGGCIGHCTKIETENGSSYFLKRYDRSGVAEAEADGLKELQKAVNTPNIIAVTDRELLLEYIVSQGESADFSTQLGEQLAALHRVTAKQFGFHSDNYIGQSPQKNGLNSSWSDFYIENRLIFQLKLAKRKGRLDSNLQQLSKRLIDIIPEILQGSEEPPTLLHGDLWSGNVMTNGNGDPVFIDPAVYYGHRETDIAMTTLFGGFRQEFYDSYNRAFPLRKGWENRLNLYKLYHILNHLNLFGNSYYSQTLSLIKSYL